MNQLEEFEKKLYKRGGEDALKKKEYEVYKEDDKKIAKEGWDERVLQTTWARARKRNIIIPLFALFFSATVAWGYYWYVTDEAFRTAEVKGGISGPDRISAGDEVSFSVAYRNNTEAALREAQIIFSWPEGSVPLEGSGAAAQGVKKMKADIGTILPGQEKSATFRGRVYGPRDAVKTVSAVFRYVPEGFSSPFEDEKTFSFTIISTPFALNLNVPAQVVSEKELTIKIEFVNQSDARFEDIILKATYPSGFTFISADPAPVEENTVWKLPAVEGRASGVITVKGSFAGAQGESKPLFVEIGSLNTESEFIQYASASSVASIASSALFVFQTVNDSRDFVANPGSPLRYKVRYKNTTNVQIPNAVIIAKIDEQYIDIRSLSVQWGSFDGRTNSVIWNAVGVPDLAVLDPKAEGEVSFSVNLKPVFLPKSFSDKNLTVSSFVKITSSVPPESLSGLPIESEDTMTVKINTQFSFNEKAYWRDGLIQNTGPLPPRVGERTTYAISWQLSNTINDVSDVEATAVIPPNVEWTGAVSPQDAALTYDPNSGVVSWKPGTVFAGTGLLTPPARVDFQVAFTPALVHTTQMINLISGAQLKAVDTFTGLKIERQVPAVNSDLLNSLKGDEGRVLQ